MARPFDFPDPKDCTVNKPHYLAERSLIIALYNQSNPDQNAQKLSATVREWFTETAINNGWESVEYVNDAAVMRVSVSLS